jgi:peptidoglycan/LPS O-acetylase OafA/YrhL
VLTNALRFALMFLAGMVVFRYQDRLPVSLPIVAGAFLVTLLAMFLPNYRIVAAFFLAYALIAAATFIRAPRLQLRTDISYGTYIYAFPVQQVLALAGLVALPVGVFWLLATVITAVLAFGSWMLIERNALKLKRRAASSESHIELAGQRR